MPLYIAGIECMVVVVALCRIICYQTQRKNMFGSVVAEQRFGQKYYIYMFSGLRKDKYHQDKCCF